MIKIVTEKTIILGRRGPCRKIVSVTMLTKDELPVEYLSGDKYVYLSSGGPQQVVSAPSHKGRRVGEIIREEDFQSFLQHVRECGEVLRQINHERRELAKSWQGKETFIV
jgi:hypothetical protein